DPVFEDRGTLTHLETPTAAFNLFDQTRSQIAGVLSDDYRAETRLSKTNLLGGQWLLTWVENPKWAVSDQPFFSTPLYPENRTCLDLSYAQPLLQGGGFLANTAPIVIARLETERSFFQYKDSVQELVRGTIEGYWNLVLARVNVWAREIQVEQSE